MQIYLVTLIMNLQNLRQENDMLSMIKITQTIVKEPAVKFETKVIKSDLCDYTDAYILVTGDITATGGDANTRVAFKNCAPFTKCMTHINDEHLYGANNLDMITPM